MNDTFVIDNEIGGHHRLDVLQNNLANFIND
jgi:hypothetical protein